MFPIRKRKATDVHDLIIDAYVESNRTSTVKEVMHHSKKLNSLGDVSKSLVASRMKEKLRETG